MFFFCVFIMISVGRLYLVILALVFTFDDPAYVQHE